MAFYTIEGIDGSGKSTLANALTSQHKSVIITQEPTHSVYGQRIRDSIARDTSDAMTNLFLFMSDRIYHINDTIRPIDTRGDIVISDRYTDSSRAYQSVELANSMHFDSPDEARAFIDNMVSPWEYVPDTTFYLDISVDTAMSRIDGNEKYEHRTFLTAVKQQYDIIAESSNHVITIDAERPPDAIAREVSEYIDGPR